MYDKIPCGNTQAEIDRDHAQYDFERSQEHRNAVAMICEQKKEFITNLMTNGYSSVKCFGGTRTYYLNDAVQDIHPKGGFWYLEVEYENQKQSIDDVYENDPDFVIELITSGKLPTNLEKIVKSAVETLADEVLGDE